jgi:capsular exopolysaccharide synthesis family protein
VRFKLIGSYPKAWPGFLKRKVPVRRAEVKIRPPAPAPALLGELPFSLTEAYKSLRTSLLYSWPDKTIRDVVITSCGKADGKTTISINLALALAEAGFKVLLVDADLRAPSVGRYLGLQAAPGLVNLLAKGDVSLLPQLRCSYAFKGGSIDVLTSGTIPAGPSELLGSQKMRDFMREAGLLYDYVLYDTPPVLPVTDAVVLSCYADGVIIVCNAGVTPKKAPLLLRKAFEDVGANILGCVLNNAEESQMEMGGRYKYKYY